MPSGKTYFITGANRGVGFELATAFASTPENIVIATTRNPENSTELTKLAESNKNVHIVKLDVSSQDSINGLDAQLKDISKDGIDVFISNAAIAKTSTSKPIFSTEWDDWSEHYTTNVVGALFTAKAVYPYMLKKDTKQMVFISSSAGSLTGFYEISSSAYGQSKAALNHSVLTLAFELKSEGFTVTALHPGVVTTDMGKAAASAFPPEIVEMLKTLSITPQESGEAIAKVVDGLTPESNGKFLSYDGSVLPY